MEEVLQKIVETINKENRRMLIGISGHGAAGKTWFAEQLIKCLKGSVNYLNTDPYIVTGVRNYTRLHFEYNQQMYSAKMTACHPQAHHVLALKRDIQMIQKQLDFFTIETDYMESTLIRSSNPVNIIEGMSVAFVEPHLFDLSIYLYCDGVTELRRRAIRDVTERGVQSNILKKSHQQRRIQYQRFMHPYSENFKIIINTSNDNFLLEKFDA